MHPNHSLESHTHPPLLPTSPLLCWQQLAAQAQLSPLIQTQGSGLPTHKASAAAKAPVWPHSGGRGPAAQQGVVGKHTSAGVDEGQEQNMPLRAPLRPMPLCKAPQPTHSADLLQCSYPTNVSSLSWPRSQFPAFTHSHSPHKPQTQPAHTCQLRVVQPENLEGRPAPRLSPVGRQCTCSAHGATGWMACALFLGKTSGIEVNVVSCSMCRRRRRRSCRARCSAGQQVQAGEMQLGLTGWAVLGGQAEWAQAVCLLGQGR